MASRLRGRLGRVAAACGAGALGAATVSSAAPHSTTGNGATSVTQPRDILSQWQQPPPFTLDGERFDMSCYTGRACHFINVLGDVSTLVLSRAQVDTHLALLQRFEADGQQPSADGVLAPSDAELWRARKVRDAVIHPETGEMIPAPFRFSAFAPANLVICAGLLASATSPSLLPSALWQWVNQSYNVGVNYVNRSCARSRPKSSCVPKAPLRALATPKKQRPRRSAPSAPLLTTRAPPHHPISCAHDRDTG
eukprot:1365468-Prymnesium_polylepis.1